jgi:hypothetical protein
VDELKPLPPPPPTMLLAAPLRMGCSLREV